MDNSELLDLLALQQKTIEMQQRTIETIGERLAKLESAESARAPQHAGNESLHVGARAASQGSTTSTGATVVHDSGMSRRRMLAAAATMGSGLLLVRGAQPAAAANGSPFTLGQANDASSTTSLANSAGGGPTTLLQVTNTSGATLAEGVRGTANGTTAAGVVGASDNGYGLYGDSVAGYSVYVGGNGRIGFDQHVVSGPPTSGVYRVGDIVRDSLGSMFACVGAGNPGTWKRIVSAGSAGIFQLLDPSVRAIDSRISGGALSTSQRTVSLASAGVPSTATAVSVNLTVTETGPAGWAALFSPTTGWGGTSTINWFAPSTTIANAAIVAIANQQISIRVSGTCQFIIDVNGYWT